MKKVTGIFKKSEGFGFVISEKKDKKSSDYFISKRNFSGAKNGDLVEIEIFEKSKGKNTEARIIKVVKEKLENKLKEGNIIGKYSQARDGDYGFVDTLDGLKGYYVFGRNKSGAMNNDIVEANIKVFKGKEEAVIERIVERAITTMVGKFQIAKGNFGFVLLRDKIMKSDVFVPLTNSMGAKSGDIVGVEIVKFNGKNPEGIIKEIISKKGTSNKREEEILTIAIEMGAKITFPEKVKSELSKIPENISHKDLEGRTDLKNLFTFTIDGIDAKDLDDAISIEKMENGDYKLYVHIADVSNYITEDSLLDKEAKARGTSIYLADRVIPMIPEKLSNNLCSLNPHTEKLTLTCEMHIGGKTGHLIKSRVYESFISSDFRLTYKEIDKILDGTLKVQENLDFKGVVSKKLLDTLKISDELKGIILNFRKKSGNLDFDFPETYVVFDKAGNPIGVKEYPKYNSNKLIEAFMVSANEAIGKEFSKFPFLYRIHKQPKEDDIKELEYKLQLFGLNFKFKKADTLEFGEVLEKIQGLEDAKRIFLEKMVLRTLTQAVYSDVNFGHFGLGLEFYSHFTSPIRRYPDLQIHRIIKEHIHHKLKGNRISHYKDILSEVGKLTSERERMSEKIEYKVRDYFMVKYYKDKIGQEFDSVISGVISKGFFVILPNSVEGFVELEKSQFDEKMQTHKLGKKTYMLGEALRVKLIIADEKLLRLNFEIVEG